MPHEILPVDLNCDLNSRLIHNELYHKSLSYNERTNSLAHQSGLFAPNESELHVHWLCLYKVNVKTIHNQKETKKVFSIEFTLIFMNSKI